LLSADVREDAAALSFLSLTAARREVGAVIGAKSKVLGASFRVPVTDNELGLRRLPLRRHGFVANGNGVRGNVVNVVVVGMGLSDMYRLIRFVNFCNFFTFCTGILCNLRILGGRDASHTLQPVGLH